MILYMIAFSVNEGTTFLQSLFCNSFNVIFRRSWLLCSAILFPIGWYGVVLVLRTSAPLHSFLITFDLKFQLHHYVVLQDTNSEGRNFHTVL